MIEWVSMIRLDAYACGQTQACARVYLLSLLASEGPGTSVPT